MEAHWEIVNKQIGRVRDYSAMELWKDSCDYFLWCDTNPIIDKRSVKVGKAATEKMNEEHIRPYTIKGLCLHCGIDESYLKSMRQTKDEKSEFFVVVSKILYIIHTQNLEHALVGLYNPGIAGKILAIGEEEQVNQGLTINIVQGLPKLLESEQEILANLENEDGLFPESENEKS